MQETKLQKKILPITTEGNHNLNRVTIWSTTPKMQLHFYLHLSDKHNLRFYTRHESNKEQFGS